MKVAAIVITYNDGYKFKEWVDHHELYKDELYMHIIVDNGSNPEYLTMVEQNFANSTIIKRTTNGGCTAAYNDGIRIALSDPEVDAIMLIGNDMKLERGGITRLSQFLDSNLTYGMVAPIILDKDSDSIEDFGCEISRFLMMKPYDAGKKYSEISVSERIVTSVTGGMNLSSRKFYEKVGFQDDNLFMYSDEVDMAIRSKEAGFKMAVTAEVKSWHQHINLDGTQIRNNSSTFLGSRNKVYLAKKYFGIIRVIMQFFYFVLLFIGLSFREKLAFSKIRYFSWSVIGAFYGLINCMEIPKFIDIENPRSLKNKKDKNYNCHNI